jgi:hypothetical protein
MRDELVAYLLNDADPEQRQRIERHLANDPTWQHEYERLRECLEAHKSDPEKAACPPEDLVHRTCNFVQRVVREGKCTPPGALTPASLRESRDGCAGTRRWSLTDLTVGCGILLALGMLLLPALVESRDAARRAKCQDNLREIGGALRQLVEFNHRSLPHIGYRENAGMFVVELADSGVISRKDLAELLVCPNTQLAEDVNSGKLLMRVPTREELAQATPEALMVMQKYMGGSYAYQFGYIDENNHYLRVKFVGRGDVPMLADAPSYSTAGFQSANHGGCGQNVIFQDLSNRYLGSCVFRKSGDHLFLNADGQHAAGRNDHDAVLGRTEVTPAGLLAPIDE